MTTNTDDASRTKSAIIAYIAYRATNIARHAGGVSSSRALELLNTLMHDAIHGHDTATKVVQSAFVRLQRQRTS